MRADNKRVGANSAEVDRSLEHLLGPMRMVRPVFSPLVPAWNPAA